jgi:hypothetical protein
MTTKYTLLFASGAYLLQLSHQDNEILTTNFIENEIYDAIMQMEKSKAPGPDDFPMEFYQKIWGMLKGDLLLMLNSIPANYHFFIIILVRSFFF